MIGLNHTELATDEDKAYDIDKWARLFKSKNWEDVKMIATKNEYIDSAARSMYKKELDDYTLRLCQRLDEELPMKSTEKKGFLNWKKRSLRRTRRLKL